MPDNIMQKKLKTDKENTFIVVRLYYDKGGMNYFTGVNESRGYYLSAGPEEIANGFRSFGAFTGLKSCILQASRKSPKQEKEALAIAFTKEDEVIKAACVKNKLSLV